MSVDTTNEIPQTTADTPFVPEDDTHPRGSPGCCVSPASSTSPAARRMPPTWPTSSPPACAPPVPTCSRPRALTAAANVAGRISDDYYVRYLWRRVRRDDQLARHALALRDRTWPPLRDKPPLIDL
ncbi:MAG: hypothetical protein IRZ08_11305 [Frankia sp.]|nr:hypothetical protein [Frankia sp.]